MLIDIDINKPSDFLIKQLNIGWIFGVIYFLLGLLEGAADYFRYFEDGMIFSTSSYVIFKISVLITFIFFQRSFIMIGGLFRNYLLKITSFILICGIILLIVLDIASIFYDSLEHEFILIGVALSFGVIGIMYGVSLYRLKKSVGKISQYAGFLEIIAGCFCFTIVLSFVGIIVMIPAELLEVVIIYKVIEIIKLKQNDSVLA